MTGPVIDLFAGPGGWDLAARDLGIDPLGIEWDDAACATRQAFGLRTLQADVAALNPEDHGPCWGLIASPPCQTFSTAGKRDGVHDTQHIIACANDLADGLDTRNKHRARCRDERSLLVVDPLRWVRDLKPRWAAFEQVPPVLELWELFAHLMHTRWGYRTWTGVLSAERYGVPQTRRRAFLLASLDRQPQPPRPTHQAFVPGEPQRHEVTLEGEVLPWVSMAEALGWDTPQVVALDRRQTGGDGTPVRPRAVTEPAPTLQAQGLAKGRDVWTSHPESWVMRASAQANATVRALDEPAPTITGGHDTANREWQRVGNNPDSPGSMQGIRVTVQEAAILQGFPPDYPWQGPKTARYQQIGNAVPPPLARAVLAQLVDASEEEQWRRETTPHKEAARA